MNSAVFELSGVSFSYPDRGTVLEDVSLSIGSGSLTLVHGESGAGKSTFLRLFNRFCEYDSGMILHKGRPLRDYPIEELRSSVIYLPQIPMMIDGTVEDNLRLPFSFAVNSGKRYDAPKAMEWLRRFELSFDLSADARCLSVGEKQRVAFIRALLLEPEVMLLDEPTSALDEKNRSLIEKEIFFLISDTGITVIMAAHGVTGLNFKNPRRFVIRGRRMEEIS
jgi:putative ABC transport system ATP-binding protein